MPVLVLAARTAIGAAALLPLVLSRVGMPSPTRARCPLRRSRLALGRAERLGSLVRGVTQRTWTAKPSVTVSSWS